MLTRCDCNVKDLTCDNVTAQTHRQPLRDQSLSRCPDMKLSAPGVITFPSRLPERCVWLYCSVDSLQQSWPAGCCFARIVFAGTHTQRGDIELKTFLACFGIVVRQSFGRLPEMLCKSAGELLEDDGMWGLKL